MTLEERRKEYLRDYVALKSIPTWMEDLKSKSESDGENAKEDLQGKRSLSEKVSLYRGDITVLEVDAIVNAGRWLNVLCCCISTILYVAGSNFEKLHKIGMSCGSLLETTPFFPNFSILHLFIPCAFTVRPL
uniref:Uncharacterized protein n=1 Tax=Calidris pygmaea TaxID=425635 RepID=A0A8C3KJN8_9CHAR